LVKIAITEKRRAITEVLIITSTRVKPVWL
jgi:hypothetical protein